MLQPTQDFVLLELMPGTAVTKHGVLIPETSKNTRPTGRVRAVGPGSAVNTATGLTVAPVSVAIGEVVLFNPNGSYNVRELIDGEEKPCVLVRERDILGIESTINPDSV